MNTQRAQAIGILGQFLLVDRSFPPLIRERIFGKTSIAEARTLEKDLAAALPGWRAQSFPRVIIGVGRDTAHAVYHRWYLSYLIGLDAGVRGVTALVEPEFDAHRERWMLAYDLGDRLRTGG